MGGSVTCDCGCGADLGGRTDQRYASAACRQRAYRARSSGDTGRMRRRSPRAGARNSDGRTRPQTLGAELDNAVGKAAMYADALGAGVDEIDLAAVPENVRAEAAMRLHQIARQYARLAGVLRP